MACRALASQRVAAIGECDIECVAGSSSVRPLLRALARHARLAVSDPGSERDRDIWDLAVFGHRGRLDFTGITQRWLRESAKRWAAHDLPRHRGAGASNVGNVVSSAARLSDSLAPAPTGAASRPRWDAATSKASSAGSPTWKQPARSAASSAT
jgi:hypothetical protein